jgi:hypothetical protein
MIIRSLITHASETFTKRTYETKIINNRKKDIKNIRTYIG